MAKRLYVGNLPYTITERSLTELFSQVGTVESVKLITDRDTGRSKGFAFVEMATEEEAQKAIASFNEKALEGRRIAVNEARPQERRGGPEGGGRGPRGNRKRY